MALLVSAVPRRRVGPENLECPIKYIYLPDLVLLLSEWTAVVMKRRDLKYETNCTGYELTQRILANCL